MSRLSSSSVDLLLRAQTANGAIPASTVHDIYQYGWLRDGSWCAYALDRVHHRDAASAWHHWVASTLSAHEHRVDQAIDAVQTHRVNGQVMMPARFTLSGQEESPGGEEWPNYQTDCYGFWLWAVADHIRRGAALDDQLQAAIRLTIRYLLAAGDQPCYDCWEEHPGHRHTSTLAAVAAGLRDAGTLVDDPAATAMASRLIERITGPDHTLAGSFIRYPGDTRVDGSLLWIAVPFALIDADTDLYRTTVKRVRQELHQPGGGVRRYQGDTFYGGSQWILLAASLGWSSLALGHREHAETLHAWIEAQADHNGHLPEQIANNVQSPHMLAYWQARWGATATPLLWSHAMHIVLTDELNPDNPPTTQATT